MAAGDFSASALLAIKLKAEQMWTDSRLSAEYKANSETAKAVLQNQTASFRELEMPDKDLQVVVNFLNPCAIVAEDCVTNCDLTEDELESGAKTYALDLCKKTGFSVDAFKTRTNSYSVEDVSARGLALSLKALDEYWSVQMLQKLKAFAGVNVAPAPWTYAAGTTTVPAADYNLSMVANLLNQAVLNKMPSAYYIDNGGLFVPFTNAAFEGGNSDGRGNVARMNALKLYFDQWNFAKAAITEDTFAVAPGAVAMVTRAKNPQAPIVIGGNVQQTRYSVASPTLDGVRYDVFYTLDCKTVAGKDHIMHTWRLETNGGIFLNPEGCPVTIGGTEYTPTGVMSYSKGA